MGGSLYWNKTACLGSCVLTLLPLALLNLSTIKKINSDVLPELNVKLHPPPLSFPGTNNSDIRPNKNSLKAHIFLS